MKKVYDYDAILNETRAGGRLDQVIGNLQSVIQKLTQKVEATEENYHGKGNDSLVRKSYQALYDTIGFENGSSMSGLWATVYSACMLGEEIYANAEFDRKMDMGEF